MTILDVKNQLISHLLTHTSFAPSDIGSINVGPDLDGQQYNMVCAAFDDFEKDGMVRGFTLQDGLKTWVLTRPLGDFVQEITLSPMAAEAIANTINGFVNANELNWPTSDKMNMHEGDILTLVEIIHEMLELRPMDDGDDENDRN